MGATGFVEIYESGAGSEYSNHMGGNKGCGDQDYNKVCNASIALFLGLISVKTF